MTVWSEIEQKIEKANKEVLKAVDDGFEGSKSLVKDNTSKLKENSEKTGETAVDEIKDSYKLLEEKFRNVDKKLRILVVSSQQKLICRLQNSMHLRCNEHLKLKAKLSNWYPSTYWRVRN